MAQTIKLKRTATPSNVPTTAQLELGEIAVNTYDGNVYIKKNDGADAIVKINANPSDLNYFVNGEGTVAGTWLGTDSDITSYYDGLVIWYRITINGAATTTLNINGLGAKTVYRYATAKLTTHWPIGSVIPLVYSTTLNGGSFIGGYDWSDGTQSYDLRWSSAVINGSSIIHGYQLLMEGADTKFYPVTVGGVNNSTTNVVQTAPLRIGGQMLYYNSATDIAVNAVIGGNLLYESIESGEGEYWMNRTNSSSWTAIGLPLYIVGTVNANNELILDNSTTTAFLTNALPTTEDGKIYIHVGYSDNEDDLWRLSVTHPIFEFKAGAIRRYTPALIPSEVLDAVKTVDGASSGLDADLLDGQHGSYYATAASVAAVAALDPVITLTGAVTGTGTMTNLGSVSIATTATSDPVLTLTGDVTGTATFTNLGNATLTAVVADDSHNHVISNVDGLQTALDAKLNLTGGTLTGQLLRSAHNTGFFVGGHNNIGSTAAQTSPIYTIGTSYVPAATTLGDMYGIGFGHSGNGSFLTSVSALTQGTGGWGQYVASDGDARIFLNAEQGTILSTGQHYANGSVVWNAGNDGSGSGLDADLLDGLQGSRYVANQDGSRYTTDFNAILTSGFYNAESAPANAPGAYGQLIVAKGIDTGMQIYGGYNNDNLWFRGWASSGASLYPWRKVWHGANDGAGSGLDADLLDGQQGSYYAPATGGSYLPLSGGTVSGTLTLDNGGASSTSLVMKGSSPTISFLDDDDVNADDFYIHVNSNRFYILANRTDAEVDVVGNNWETPHPMYLDSSNNTGYLFDQRMFADNYHPNADTWTTARTLGVTLTGDVTGSATMSVNGGSNQTATITTVVANDSHSHQSLGGFGGLTEYTILDGPGNGPVWKVRWDGATANRYWDLGFKDGYGTFYSGLKNYNNSTLTWINNTIWHAGNDGSGSGLDADLLDGQEGSYYAPASHSHSYLPLAGGTTTGTINAPTFNATSTTSGGFQGIDADTITAPSFTWTSDLNTGMWHAGTDQIGFTTAGTNQMTISTTGATVVGTMVADTFNATSTTNGGFQGIDADTITAPSFTWTSDLNTGMWHAGADAIGFTTGGVNRITINSSGISGAGGGLTALNGTNISTGTVAAARVATLNQNTTGSSGSCTGNSATATALQTARTINGVSFNGTASITVADATKLPLAGGTATGTINAPTFNATSVTSGGFQGIDADTITAPSFTWTSDLDTGMWHAAADQIGFTTAGVNRVTITSTGITAVGDVTAYSDMRLKENIEVIPNAVLKVQQLRGVTFTRNDAEDLEKRHTGVIAQEVEAVLPEAVSEDNAGIKNVAYGNMVGLLIEAIKELKSEVDSLKQQLENK